MEGRDSSNAHTGYEAMGTLFFIVFTVIKDSHLGGREGGGININ